MLLPASVVLPFHKDKSYPSLKLSFSGGSRLHKQAVAISREVRCVSRNEFALQTSRVPRLERSIAAQLALRRATTIPNR